MRFRQIAACWLLLSTFWSSIAWADTLVNWENGFEVEVPSTWLRQQGGPSGIKLNSEDVKMSIEPYSGVSFDRQIERLHKESKEAGWAFKSERTFPIHEVPAHEMIFYRDGRYLIYYVMLSGSRGFLLTLRSVGTDSEAFRESQQIVLSFRVSPSQ